MKIDNYSYVVASAYLSHYIDNLDAFLLDIKYFEGLCLKSYKPAGEKPTGDNYTIGYGHFGVPKGLTITEEEANQLLVIDLSKCLYDLNVYFDSLIHFDKSILTSNRYKALLSFVYNLGIGNFKKSTLAKIIISRNGDFVNPVVKEFRKWVYSGKNKLLGLEIRREYESILWFDVPEFSDVVTARNCYSDAYLWFRQDKNLR